MLFGWFFGPIKKNHEILYLGIMAHLRKEYTKANAIPLSLHHTFPNIHYHVHITQYTKKITHVKHIV